MDETTKDLIAVQKEADSAKQAYLAAKEVAGDKKKAWESRQAEVSERIRDLSADTTPLFKGIDLTTPGGVAAPAPELADGVAVPSMADAPAMDSEEWRETSIGAIGFRDREHKSLLLAGMKTLGDLTDFLSDGQRQLTDIAGVGAKGEEAIEVALAEFWTKRRKAR